MRLESDTAKKAECSPDDPLTVVAQRPVHGLAPENHRTRRNPADDSPAIEHLAKLRYGLGVCVRVEKVFRQSTGEPDASGACERFDEGIRISDAAVERVDHSDVLCALRFKRRLRRIRRGEADLGAARFVESGRRYEDDRSVCAASELDEAPENDGCRGARENHSSTWRANSGGTLRGDR